MATALPTISGTAALQHSFVTASRTFETATEAFKLELLRLVEAHAASLAQSVEAARSDPCPLAQSLEPLSDPTNRQPDAVSTRMASSLASSSPVSLRTHFSSGFDRNCTSTGRHHCISDEPEAIAGSCEDGSSSNKLHMHIASKLNEVTEHRAKNPMTFFRAYALSKGWILMDREQDTRLLARLVRSDAFDYSCALFIVINTALLAFSTDYAAKHHIVYSWDLPLFFLLADYLCNGWFLIELLLRMGAEGPCVFFSCLSRNLAWNIFDTTVVTGSLIELLVYFLSDGDGGVNVAALRILRVLRLLRAMRIIRLARFCHDLRIMVFSVLSSFPTLFWALVLLFLMMLVFGIFLTQNVTQYLYGDSTGAIPENSGVLRQSFGTFDRAIYTLFKSMTGGTSWQEVSDPLFAISWSTGLVFCFFIFFAIFAMTNVITSVFLESAVAAASADKDELIATQLLAEDNAFNAILQFFDELDADGSGQITLDEFARTMEDVRMRAFLASLGIDTGEAEGLFCLLDVDNSGTISTDEFLCGCMQMKGSAKAVDIQTLLYENKKLCRRWASFVTYVETGFANIDHSQKRCLEMFQHWEERWGASHRTQLEENSASTQCRPKVDSMNWGLTPCVGNSV